MHHKLIYYHLEEYLSFRWLPSPTWLPKMQLKNSCPAATISVHVCVCRIRIMSCFRRHLGQFTFHLSFIEFSNVACSLAFPLIFLALGFALFVDWTVYENCLVKSILFCYLNFSSQYSLLDSPFKQLQTHLKLTQNSSLFFFVLVFHLFSLLFGSYFLVRFVWCFRMIWYV